MHDTHSHHTHSSGTRTLDESDHCHNERCEDSQCENPRCYNYSGRRSSTHRYEDRHHEDVHHMAHEHHLPDRQEHDYPSHHYTDVLQAILQRHNHHQDSFSDAQNDVTRHQQSLQVQQLQWVNHVFTGLLRNVLERSQHELYERGFSSGIHSEIESVLLDAQSNHHHHSHRDHNDGGNEGESHDYLTAISLHLNDIPNNEPSKNITSNNQIRFYRVSDSIDIQCQFSNTKMQSKVFDLSFHHGEQQGGAQDLVEDVVQDFIGFILLSKRAGLSLGSG